MHVCLYVHAEHTCVPMCMCMSAFVPVRTRRECLCARAYSQSVPVCPCVCAVRACVPVCMRRACLCARVYTRSVPVCRVCVQRVPVHRKSPAVWQKGLPSMPVWAPTLRGLALVNVG